MKIISRKEAKALHLKRYFTGKLCWRGHTSERLASTAFCMKCKRLQNSKEYWSNPERHRARAIVLHWKNRDRRLSKKRVHYWKNRDRLVADVLARIRKNPELHRAASRKYHWENRELRLAYMRKFRLEERNVAHIQ